MKKYIGAERKRNTARRTMIKKIAKQLREKSLIFWIEFLIAMKRDYREPHTTQG